MNILKKIINENSDDNKNKMFNANRFNTTKEYIILIRNVMKIVMNVLMKW